MFSPDSQTYNITTKTQNLLRNLIPPRRNHRPGVQHHVVPRRMCRPHRRDAVAPFEGVVTDAWEASGRSHGVATAPRQPALIFRDGK